MSEPQPRAQSASAIPLPRALPSMAAERDAATDRATRLSSGAVLCLLDVLTVFAAFMISYYIKFGEWRLGVEATIASIPYLKGALLLAGVWVTLIWRTGAYADGFRGMSAPMIRVKTLFQCAAIAIAILMVVSFLYREFLLSRQVYLTTTAIGLGAMILSRMTLRALETDLALSGVVTRRILILGGSTPVRNFTSRLRADLPRFQTVRGEHAVTMTVDEIEREYARRSFDRIILSLGEFQRALPGDDGLARMIELLNYCEAEGIELYAIPDSYDVVVKQSEVGSLSGLPLLQLRDAATHRAYGAVKRVTDVLIAGTVLVVGMPLWAAIAIAIRVTSPGPVFFRQRRIGLHGRPFKMLKFRSMRIGAEAEYKKLVNVENLDVPGVKIDRDPRITTIGRWLRRTSLDEIPQLLNVIGGSMALVGPRPEIPLLVERYDRFQRRRLKAKPGITGFQQVMARNQPLAGVLHYDLTYLKEQSLFFDLYIMLRTALVMSKGK